MLLELRNERIHLAFQGGVCDHQHVHAVIKHPSLIQICKHFHECLISFLPDGQLVELSNNHISLFQEVHALVTVAFEITIVFKDEGDLGEGLVLQLYRKQVMLIEEHKVAVGAAEDNEGFFITFFDIEFYLFHLQYINFNL
ncbi:hypothetical protein FGO68_gene750 [Halteria grandinella]|uniref:Uncharacterized protein n=1 Tax=Halteria grandinella TaxID=5974 RepID=A0A8J8NIR5_HALGN|nr:hypothetical protein FGO68_gene750 [Halteria grandinella]